MARRREPEERLSLFPFLSIVICVIGFLTIMIASEALSKMGEKPDTQALERTAKYKEQLAKLKEIEEELKGRRDVEYATAFEATIKRAEEDLAELQAQKAERDQQIAEKEGQTADQRTAIDQLMKHIESIQKDIEERKKTEAELAQEVDKKRKPPAAPVAIRPGGTGKNIRPFFVECTDSSIVLHGREGSKPIRIADASSNQDYLNLLDKAATTENGIVIFLLRENGIGTYSAASNIAADRGTRNGKLPLLGQGKVDVSAFRRVMDKNDS
jgi:ATPase subunit of ABC transporter with duplicated ATPase domains